MDRESRRGRGACGRERRDASLLRAPDSCFRSRREPSGHRRYDDETVRFLRAIKDAQAVGFTLAEIDSTCA
jgi:hypothetical protein